MTLDEMEVGSPEWEAEVERLQMAEDAEREAAAAKDATAKAEADKAAAEAAAAEAKPVEQPEPAKAKAQDEPEKPAPPGGVLSKDGKTILPYAALSGSRAETRHERALRIAAEERAEALARENADLKAGKTAPVAAIESLTEQDLSELEEYSPKAAKAIAEARAAKDRIADLEKQVTEAKPKPVAQEADDDPVQEAIDQVPLLATWQAVDKVKFDRAVEIDRVMKDSPKWKGKPIETRFAHVAKMVADEYDIQIPKDDAPQSETKGPSKAADTATEVINGAARQTPNTLSDFKGGGVDQTDQRLDRMTPIQQLARVQDMSREEFDEYLAKLG